MSGRGGFDAVLNWGGTGQRMATGDSGGVVPAGPYEAPSGRESGVPQGLDLGGRTDISPNGDAVNGGVHFVDPTSHGGGSTSHPIGNDHPHQHQPYHHQHHNDHHHGDHHHGDQHHHHSDNSDNSGWPDLGHITSPKHESGNPSGTDRQNDDNDPVTTTDPDSTTGRPTGTIDPNGSTVDPGNPTGGADPTYTVQPNGTGTDPNYSGSPYSPSDPTGIHPTGIHPTGSNPTGANPMGTNPEGVDLTGSNPGGTGTSPGNSGAGLPDYKLPSGTPPTGTGNSPTTMGGINGGGSTGTGGGNIGTTGFTHLTDYEKSLLDVDHASYDEVGSKLSEFADTLGRLGTATGEIDISAFDFGPLHGVGLWGVHDQVRGGAVDYLNAQDQQLKDWQGSLRTARMNLQDAHQFLTDKAEKLK